MGSKLSLYVGVSVAAVVLAGCEDGTGLGSSRPETAATAAADRPAATRLVERDVEAPDVFQMSEAGLWDGRPSLGGVWVAHPAATDPERVMIRNAANGETVIGALFRRERTGPGPRFQVSSDAASALGMLAGAPVELDVTALRRQEAPEPAPEAEAEAAEPAALAEAEPVETEALDPIQSAAAAIDRAEASAEPAEPVSAETQASSDGEPAAPQAAPERERRGLFAGLFRRQASEPLSAISGATAVGAAAGTVVSPGIGSGEPSPQPAAARAPQAANGTYIQIGIFSVEANAKEAADALRANGIVPTIYEQQSAERTFWRVVAGPASSEGDRSALLRKVKGLGYADAYAVSS
ncbi:SPOR domain-containing protein [Rhodovulum sp. 12E13]|uniref:SPOR domain-containing protein n=1 Tax=Rhodovulum sp. 12E13 TaxID=2203891 RepID=UPI000E176E38|nr:SPOR domain-containing protein [Rhodovulum sp. 12E13]RDC72752.1 SPOR domain-containing protein [Rhodovulum sp. 12E13]